MKSYYEQIIKEISKKNIDALVDIDTSKLTKEELEDLFRMAIGSLLEKYVEEVNYGRLSVLNVAKELEKLERYREKFKDLFATNSNIEKIFNSFYIKIGEFLNSSKENGFTGLVI